MAKKKKNGDRAVEGPISVEYWPLDDLLRARHPRNPKEHALDELDRSFSRWGYTAPVILDEASGNLAAGHGRVDGLEDRRQRGEGPPERVVVKEGEWFVPVLRGIAFEGPDELLAYLLADNRLTELGGWNDSLLAQALADLREQGISMAGVGYSPEQVDAILDWRSDAPVQEDDAPDPPEEPDSERGVVYELGPHRLLCGDATDPGDLAELMGGEQAALVFTDPPYGVSYEDTGPGAWDEAKLALKEAGLLEPRFDPIAGDELRGEDLFKFLVSAFSAWREACDPSAAWYVWHASRTQILFERALNEVGYVVRAQVVWAKSRPAFNFGQYKYQHEPCFYAFRDGHVPAWHGDLTQTTLWQVPSESGAVYRHPTQKPVGLGAVGIRNSSRRGEVVLDPFAGSGSTLMAADQLDRRAFLMEIDPRYCDVIRERWLRAQREDG
jgi:DNA modification methylase